MSKFSVEFTYEETKFQPDDAVQSYFSGAVLQRIREIIALDWFLCPFVGFFVSVLVKNRHWGIIRNSLRRGFWLEIAARYVLWQFACRKQAVSKFGNGEWLKWHLKRFAKLSSKS